MTDRITRLTVVLERDIREDDCQHLMNAILCMKGVANVSGTVADPEEYDARQKVRMEVQDKLRQLIESLWK